MKDVKKIIKSLNSSKARGADNFPPKLLKDGANVIDSYIANILNHSHLNKRIPETGKIANVRANLPKRKKGRIESSF